MLHNIQINDVKWVMAETYYNGRCVAVSMGQQNPRAAYNKLQFSCMADFFIQTDKDVYFAGETVNGQIFINVGTVITGAQGVSLRFSGYECVKWVNATELHRPHPNPHAKPGDPPPFDPIAAIPPNQLHQAQSDSIQVSDIESEEDNSYDHRPKYIRTPSNRYFKMTYFETRNMFTKSKAMVYQCNGFAPGQYSFPFSFKTFEGWPASFQHITPTKKGVIIYHMTVAIEPTTKQFQLKYGREITLRETRMVASQLKKSNAEITSCCCISKGITATTIHFEKDGYAPGELVQMIMEVDNSNCKADIPTISISIYNTVTMKSNQSQTSDGGAIMSKSINGVAAGRSATGNEAIREAFNLQSNREIKPTCSGKLLSNSYSLSVMMNHDISCECCSDRVGSSIPIIIFPLIRNYAMPNIFQNNWTPKMMPNTNLALTNDFNNYQLQQMQSYPPPQQQSYPPQQQGYPPQQQQGYPPQQGYPQQGYAQQDSHLEQTEMVMR